MQLMTASVALAKSDHPNRMPFSGVLTRVDKPSDSAPSGADGKRVILTRAAAQAALPSLIGMPVGMRQDMRGHSPQYRIGSITAARVDGDALRIEGELWANDFPTEALRIRRDQADLGFSFEATDLIFGSAADDPLVIHRCTFTGAAVLLAAVAAYSTTSLAASAERNSTMMSNDDLAVCLRLSASAGWPRSRQTALQELEAARLEGKHITLARLDAAMDGRPIAERMTIKEQMIKSGLVIVDDAHADRPVRIWG
jgi:hypothetical protein